VHPATRTFQALRIFVNDELGELCRGLAGAEALLEEGGRLAVVSFHSLEDRIVKQFMDERGGRVSSGSRHMPGPVDAGPSPSFSLKGKGAVKPGKDELGENVRARSARLRAAVRTDAEAWGELDA
jgi:16S rRNA (cytosine1402-N4)-methyltransferase